MAFLTVVSGVFLFLADICAQKRSEKGASPLWFVGMSIAAILAYECFSLLLQVAELSRAASWVSMAVLFMSSAWGIVVLGEALTRYKAAGLLCAIAAVYLTSR